MRITLTVTEGPHQGEVFSFEEHDTFVVGRSPDAHFHLPEKDPYFSRIHFMVEINPPLCRLLDMGSHNGTYVNNVRCHDAQLKNADQIRAGQTVITVAIVGGPVDGANRTLTLPPAVQETVVKESPALTDTNVPSAFPSIGGYHVEAELGRGGMGVVYRAVRESDGRAVAIKIVTPAVSPSEKDLQRFLREAKILEQLDHPNIVAFRDLGETDGVLWFAMDFVPGVDASRLLKSEGPLPVARAVALISQLLGALAYAHGKGFVHRDLKPANMIVLRENGKETIKLADFGLARTYQLSQLSGLTMSGSTGGTAHFMPPEQVLNFRTVKPTADQYSAAATLYNLLTDRHVYDCKGGVQDLLKLVLLNEPVPIRSRRPDLPPQLADVIHKALARKPKDRFADATGFQQALRAFI